MVAPIIPAVNDSEIEAILKAAYAAGAREAGYVMLRLPLEVRDVFKDWLEAALPERAAKVMSLVKSVRDGKESDSAFGRRMTGVWSLCLEHRAALRTRLPAAGASMARGSSFRLTISSARRSLASN